MGYRESKSSSREQNVGRKFVKITDTNVNKSAIKNGKQDSAPTLIELPASGQWD